MEMPSTPEAVFISYRRDDSRASAGRLYDTVRQHLGADNVFKDVDAIAPGEDFRKAIDRAIKQSAAILVVIGPAWDPGPDSLTKTLTKTHDYVRLEIESALAMNIAIVPVLVDGARMPVIGELPSTIRDLTYCNAVALDHDYWDRDCKPLLERIREIQTSSETDEVQVDREKISGLETRQLMHDLERAEDRRRELEAKEFSRERSHREWRRQEDISNWTLGSLGSYLLGLMGPILFYFVGSNEYYEVETASDAWGIFGVGVVIGSFCAAISWIIRKSEVS